MGRHRISARLAISTSGEFGEALLVLDETIIRLVNTPVFKTLNTLEIDLVRKARHHLDPVTLLTAHLKNQLKGSTRFPGRTNSVPAIYKSMNGLGLCWKRKLQLRWRPRTLWLTRL